jgi:hypothetical protein
MGASAVNRDAPNQDKQNALSTNHHHAWHRKPTTTAKKIRVIDATQANRIFMMGSTEMVEVVAEVAFLQVAAGEQPTAC